MPHLDAAYNLARWLTRNEHDAEDVVQEAYLRAFRYFASFRGGDSRTWLLAIVRNVYNTWVQRKSSRASEGLSDEAIEDIASPLPSPEAKLLQTDDRQRLRQALEQLPLEYREVIVLR